MSWPVTEAEAYAAQAAQFQARHGFPAPPQDLLAGLPEWPIPFCAECSDWHEPSAPHSAEPEGEAAQPAPPAWPIPEVSCCGDWLPYPTPGITSKCPTCQTVFALASDEPEEQR